MKNGQTVNGSAAPGEGTGEYAKLICIAVWPFKTNSKLRNLLKPHLFLQLPLYG